MKIVIANTLANVHYVATAAMVAAVAIGDILVEDVIRGIIAVVVICAIAYEVVVQSRTPDPWLQWVSGVLIGYYFGLATKAGVGAVRQFTKGGKRES